MNKEEEKAMAMGLFRDDGRMQSNYVLRTTYPIWFMYFYTVTIINIKMVQAGTRTNKMMWCLSLLVM